MIREKSLTRVVVNNTIIPMRHSTLFIDESGKSSLSADTSEPFILTGVILDEDDIKTVEGFFNYIKRKYGIDTTLPFHSYELLEKPETKIEAGKAKGLLKTSADFISLIPIQIRLIEIDRENFKKALGIKSNNDFKNDSERKEIKEFPYRIMSAKLFTWFADYLKKCEGIGQIIADARRGGNNQLLKSLDYCRDPEGPLGEELSTLIKERCNAICFAEKNFLSGGLEITDLISYTSFFHARRKMNSMKDVSLPTVWKEIKDRLPDHDLTVLKEEEIKKFFDIGSDGVYKSLKKNP